MVVPTASPNIRSRRARAIGIPTIDLSLRLTELPDIIVKACEELGFFQVVNHGLSQEAISRLEEEAVEFFAKTTDEKRLAGPANPTGYGCKNIGPNGDTGELEYLLLRSDTSSVDERSNTISNDPVKFSSAVNDYIHEVRELASEILDLVCEGLRLSDRTAFSNLIRDVQSDSLLRINHYAPSINGLKAGRGSPMNFDQPPRAHGRVGFGEHSDPQILTILRSNDVEGLQICSPDGLWVSVPPHPDKFYVIVGDALQVLTNGRFTSVRHRVILLRSTKPRMSMVYFGAPTANSWIAPRPELVSPERPCLYKPFTWGEYKRALYSLRLADSRLDLFKIVKTVNREDDRIILD